MKASINFAQLSDPHLTSPQGASWYELANKRLLGYLSWRRRRRFEHRGEVLAALRDDLQQTRPDHLVITGDLTHIGLPDEFQQARRWLETLGKPADITVVPGNHDAYVRVPWHTGLSCWAPWMASDPPLDGGHAANPEAIFPSLRRRGPVAFIGLSSAFASAPLMATGRLGKRQLQRLDDMLQRTGDEGLFRVVLLHHPPVPGQVKWRKRLTDAGPLRQLIERRGAELVLHGHDHRELHTTIDVRGAQVPVFGIPSASYLGHRPDRGARYYLYRVTPGEGVWDLAVTVRAYQPGSQQFVAVNEWQIQLPS